MLAHPVILLRVNKPEVVNAAESHNAAVLDRREGKKMKGVGYDHKAPTQSNMPLQLSFGKT